VIIFRCSAIRRIRQTLSQGEGRFLVPGIAAGFAAAALLVTFVLFRTRNLGTGAS
jgi:hypothetical protein